MRVEDLDAGRVREEFVGGQLGDLAAIGLDWDGPVVRQSERGELYADALARLDTYECFCTRAEIRDAASAPHGPLPEGFYPGTCLRLTRAEGIDKTFDVFVHKLGLHQPWPELDTSQFRPPRLSREQRMLF